MGAGSHDLSRPRARAAGVRPSRCGGRSCPARSHTAVAVATICRSGASRDQESRKPVADETRLTNGDLYCSATRLGKALAADSLNLPITDFLEYLVCGGGEPTSSCRHDIRQAGRTSIPGGLSHLS